MRVTISRRARGLLRFRFLTPDADMSDADMLHDASGIFAGLPPTYPVLLLPNSTPEWEPDSAPPVARGDGASFPVEVVIKTNNTTESCEPLIRVRGKSTCRLPCQADQ